jgi:Zn-dependent protease/CBS domain-containing protein
MKWSTKVGTFAGIDVYVHTTFLMLVAWVGFVHWQEGRSAAAALAGMAFVLALFLCVLLHEFGHALTAQRFGISTRNITLLPIGGLAQLERMPDNPVEELWVALAGPAVNVVIAAVLGAVWFVTEGPGATGAVTLAGGSIVERLMVVNVVLVLFNLLPAFPMDGGRVLRALLAMRMPYAEATRVAANVGQGMALFFGLVGLFFNPFLIFIALFVWIGAGQEAAQSEIRSVLGGVPLEQAMLTDFRTLAPDDTLARAVELLLAGTQQDFPVVDERGDVHGILTRADLLTALARQEQHAPVAGVMRRDFMIADAADDLDDVLQALQARACHTVPIMSEGRLVGLLTMDNVGEFLSVQAALRGQRRPATRPF